MGHLDQAGKDGIIDILNGLDKPRKILIHINNTNPILVDDSPERQALTKAGIEVSQDGMQIEL
jgi:pyrroloquinoline quinone biosynthesis protein B